MSLKQKFIDQIIANLESELAGLQKSVQAAHEAATHEESKAEDQYDTRGLEASYLAGAQASRAAELKQLLAMYKFFPVREFKAGEAIDSGALVELELNGKKFHYFLVSQGGGVSATIDGKRIQVVTPQAPLGEALLGRKLGDTVEVEAQNAVREYEVTAVE